MDGLCLRTGIPSISGRPADVPAAVIVVGNGGIKTSGLSFSIKRPFRSLYTGAKRVCIDDAVSVDGNGGAENEEGRENAGEFEESEGQNWKWRLNFFNGESVRSEVKGVDVTFSSSSSCCEACDCESDDTNGRVFDRNSFSKLLKRVSLSDARMYAQMSYLGNLAYAIPNIKPRNLLKWYGLRYVTSSIEKREQLNAADDKDQPSNQSEAKETVTLESTNLENDKNDGRRINLSAGFQIAASAASYLNARGRHILGFSEEDKEHISEIASSFMSNNDSVAAVVAAKEEVKQAVADDLNSVSSTPCEWYICDDEKSSTRYFIIQGSETMSSWQANLLFEPIHFEGFDTFVHRGIYEAAKGMYQQMLPEIREHMEAHGKRTKFRFSGHSLGGSLSLLINLMLLIRNEVPVSSLLPVITFGSPTVMCGGDELLQKLGLPRTHVQAVTMHRDIVPRVFSCNYPSHVAKFLKAVNRNFRHHPCLNVQKFLYGPMGELIILQPEVNFSPSHALLPAGSGLYHLNPPHPDAEVLKRLLKEASLAFLNSPHPLEILKDRSAYGRGGAIQRDHDMKSYLKSVRSVVQHELDQIRRERSRGPWWSLVLPRVISGGNVGLILRSGSESLRRIVASKNLHLFVLLLPARLFLVGAYSFLGVFRHR